MTLNRRRLVKLGSAATLGAMLPQVASGAGEPDNDYETALNDTLHQVDQTFAQLGFSQSPALPIVTGDVAYNGGLRHDFDQSALPVGSYVVQPLARVADVGEKSRHDILPIFHEIGCHPSDASDGLSTTRLMLRLLVQDLGLEPARIAFVSVPQAQDMRSVLDEMGLPFAQKVLLRDEAEALAARDASGFFFPDPFGDDFLVTMGVYYRVGASDAPAPASYPPTSDWTEIGEIIIGGDAAPLGISLGLERLTYAASGLFPTWDQRLPALFAQVEQEGAEPSGLAAFR